MQVVLDGIIFTCNEDIPIGEAKEYVKRGHEKYGSYLNEIIAEIDGDEVELTYRQIAVPFERVRRITGYLVGTLDRFNDAKRAEESERVKHIVGANRVITCSYPGCNDFIVPANEHTENNLEDAAVKHGWGRDADTGNWYCSYHWNGE